MEIRQCASVIFFLFVCVFKFNTAVTTSELLARINNTAPALNERPSWLGACKKNDPKLDECLQHVFLKMFPQLALGIPEINVEPFEPLKLPEVTVSKGHGAVTLSGGLFNLFVRGPSKAVPTYSHMDFEKMKFDFGIDIPQLDINSNYNLKGKILVLPLVGHGLCKLILKEVKTAISTNMILENIDGREVLLIKDMKVNFRVGYMNVELNNLFNGNKVLGKTVNNFLNQNGLEVISELSDNIGDSLAIVFTNIMNNIFSKIPTDLWLLDE